MAGEDRGKKVVGYRQEDRVQPESGTETFAEVRLEIANWRWAESLPFADGQAPREEIYGSTHHFQRLHDPAIQTDSSIGGRSDMS